MLNLPLFAADTACSARRWQVWRPCSRKRRCAETLHYFRPLPLWYTCNTSPSRRAQSRKMNPCHFLHRVPRATQRRLWRHFHYQCLLPRHFLPSTLRPSIPVLNRPLWHTQWLCHTLIRAQKRKRMMSRHVQCLSTRRSRSLRHHRRRSSSPATVHSRKRPLTSGCRPLLY